MGCAASKLENEDTVRRCKERRRLIKSAVVARHHLAAAHADYFRSLRLTGSTLSSFAQGEPLSVSPQTPPIHVNTTPTFSKTDTSRPKTNFHNTFSPSSYSSFSTSQRGNNHPNNFCNQKQPKLPHILSESGHSSPQRGEKNVYNFSNKNQPNLPHILTESGHSSGEKNANNFGYRKQQPKLPHILSESSPSGYSTPREAKKFDTRNNTYKAEDLNYSETTSQTSSVWNWENFYPPSPPPSEFFEKKNNQPEILQSRLEKGDRDSVYSDFFERGSNKSKYRSKEDHGEDNVSVYSDFFERGGNKNGFRSESFKHQMHNHAKSDRASVYSEFSERGSNKEYVGSESFRSKKEYVGPVGSESFRSKKDYVDKDGSYNYKQERSEHHLEVDEETDDREEVQYSEWDDHYNSTTSSSDELESSRSEIRVPPAAQNEYTKPDKYQNEYQNGGSSFGEHEMSNDMRMVVRHRDLVEIVAAIREYFDKAASAGEQVGVLLEIGRAQLDRSFSKLKKTVYHSSGVFSNLSSSWTSKPPLAVKYQFEPSSMVEPGGSKSLCSTLERLLAWEKKLYQEVKAREGVKIEHEKKLSSLQSHECRGDNEAKLDKTKAEINRLQSLILVTSQAVSTTSSAIVGVRDAELVPQLVELCHGFMYMWRSMYQFHEIQNQIVQQVRGLVNQSMKGESTSDLHRQATRDLESAVSAWHSSFCRLIKFQRDFICSLHGWFKLTLLPLNTEPINGNVENSEAFSFYDEWKLALDRLPDTVASEAIKSFINVVHSISLKQTEELKIKKRTESASKELEKKASSLRSIEKKYYHSYSMVGIGLPDTGPDNGHVLDARDPLAEKKFELEGCRRRVEDEMLRHSKAVEVTRAMTLNNIQTGLPGVFQAMTSFSALVMEALETVCTRSYAIK